MKIPFLNHEFNSITLCQGMRFAQVNLTDDVQFMLKYDKGDYLFTPENVKAREKKYQFGSCDTAQLTDRGKAHMEEIGEGLRKLYIENYKLDVNSSNVYVRSTNIPRAIQSAQHLLFAFFGKHFPKEPINISVMDERDEYLYPNFRSCPKLKRMFDSTYQAMKKEFKKETDTILSEMQSNLITSRKVSIHDVYDTLACAEAHNLPFPSPATEETLKKSETIISKVWWKPFEESTELIKLGVGPLVHDVLFKILTSATNESDTKVTALFIHFFKPFLIFFFSDKLLF